MAEARQRRRPVTPASGPTRRARETPERRLAPAGASAGQAEEADGTRVPRCEVAFCPICLAVTAMGEARPELVEHLLVAAREMLLAVRALIDVRLEGGPEPARLERLTIE